MIYVPTQYHRDSPVPLWILAHGNEDTPEVLIKMAGMVAMAEKHNFAFAALAAEKGAFNVGLDAQVFDPNGPDDVDYTRTVLMEVKSKLNVDMQRIRCAGFSRGARFCSRLASELSSFITGIAVVSGIRFPKPNNATRPLPVIAFHGTEDPVNPYNGMGNAYWLSSVDDAVQRWADFNGCTQHRWERVSTQVLKSLHTGCKDGADVVLVQIVHGGHTWPGSWYDFGDLGYVTHEIDASETLREFFVHHPVPENCHTAVEGDTCYKAAKWAKEVGVYKHPDWYKELTSSSSLRAFQAHLHTHIAADCPMPCPRPGREHPANASRAATPPSMSAAAVPSAEPTTTTRWVAVRWLEEDEEHVVGVMWRYWIRPPVIIACGGAALLAALATISCRAFARSRLRMQPNLFHPKPFSRRPLQLSAYENRLRSRPGPDSPSSLKAMLQPSAEESVAQDALAIE